jgi:hypothetical protein
MTQDTSMNWDDLRDRFTTVLGLHERVPSAVLRRAMVDETYAHRLMVSRGSPAMLAALLRDKRNLQYDVPDDPPMLPVSVAGVPASVAASVPASATMSSARTAAPASTAATAPARSTLSLAAQAAAALVKWGKAGFTQVDADTYARRTSACDACPHLLEPPDGIAYSIRLKRGEDLRACGLCGCVASRKARLPRREARRDEAGRRIER